MLDMQVKDYRITSDARQVILSRAIRNEVGELYERKSPKGEMEEARSVIGYYSNLSKALVGLQRDYVLHGTKPINDIKIYKEELETITKACEDKLRITEPFS
ncbi:hypothetical protein [Candidatus Enterococcus ferrettii]|uniref:DUF5405 domain-containing protein n=1 Tax=Candidatus Enterococcus ferrettii TaxID=2815324 RepID=A0ABV0EI34_9ENTE|nr:hypothetical protein [Enterococcus sp. 665A]MBO1341877.1 hypothetical protein [Enterococcus sp. 665A]